jgi:hypothetical protein
MVAAESPTRDMKVLARFIETYCKHQHEGAKSPFEMKQVDLRSLLHQELNLCDDCRHLLAHGLVMRLKCPHDPKPRCKDCPSPCYAPSYRAQIRNVMRFSGKRLVLSGRLDYLWHLLF